MKRLSYKAAAEMAGVHPATICRAERLGIAVEVTPLDFDPAREVKRWRRAGTDYRDAATGARVEVMHDQTMPHVVFRITPGHANARAYDIDLADLVRAVLDLHHERMAERRAA